MKSTNNESLEQLEEKLDDLWEYIAHVYGVDAEKQKDLDNFRNSDESYLLENFECCINDYNEIKRKISENK